MKKLLIILSFLLAAVTTFAQFPARKNLDYAPNVRTWANAISVDSGLIYRVNFTDTANANIGYLKNIPGIVIRVGDDLWMRNNTATQWVGIGGQALEVEDSPTIDFGGIGTFDDPLTASVIPSGQPYNILQTLSDGVYVPTYIQNGRQEGGYITWVSGYTYDVTATIYYINGVQYVAPEDQITLPNADPTNDRIDLVVVNTDSEVEIIEGTPAEDPQQPSYDPQTQLPLGFILVTAGSTQPSSINQDWIYLNNAEWTTSSSTARINAASTNNPYSPPLDIEGILARNNDSITFTDPTQPTNMANYQVLTLKLRSQGTWLPTTRITFRWFNDGVAQGVPVYISQGTFGFNSANTTTYQTITIPKQLFGNLGNVDLLFMTVSTATTGAVSFYIDDIQILGADGAVIPNPGGNFWNVGGNQAGALFVGGTLDDQPIQLVANNTQHTRLLTNGSTWMQGTNPGLSLYLGTFAAGDYYIKRTSTTVTYNSAGAHAMTLSGNNVYAIDASNGHRWYGAAAALQMQLKTTGALTLSNYGDGTFAATPVYGLGVEADGDVVEFNPITAITGNNGVSNSSSSNIQLGGNPLLGNTSIPTSAYTLTINSSNSTGSLIVNNSSGAGSSYAIKGVGASGTSGVYGFGNPAGVYGETTSAGSAGVFGIYTGGSDGYGGYFVNYSAIGNAIVTETADNIPIRLSLNTSTNNSVYPIIQSAITPFGGSANGLGQSILFQFDQLAANSPNAIISRLTNAANGTAEFVVKGRSGGTNQEIFTLSGNGALKLNKYGIATFTGTPAYTLAVDASGNIIEVAGGTGITASQGLTMSTATNVTLGGTLTGAASINTSTFNLALSGTANSPTYVFDVTNSGTGNAVIGSVLSGTAIRGSATSGSGGSFVATSGNPLLSLKDDNSSTAVNDILIGRSTNSGGAGAAGLGAAIRYELENASSATTEAGRTKIVWTTATNGAEVAAYTLQLKNAGSTVDRMVVAGSGALRLNAYGINTFAGVAAYVLGVDASGNVVEVAAAGAGMANVLTTTGSMIYSSSGSTPAELLAGTAGQVLTMSGGLPTWVTPGVGGSVTTVSVASANGFAGSVANASTTPAITISTSITGLLKGNGTAISAASAGTDYVIPAGNVATATALETARTINGTSFDGTANITVTAAAGTLTGTTLNATVVTSSLTSVGTIGTGVWQGTAIGDTYISSATTWNAKQAGDATLTALAGLTITNGSLIYGTGTDAFSILSAGTNGHVLTMAGGVPTWAAAGAGTVTSVAATAPASGFTITGSPITGSGTFVFTLNGDLAGLEALTGTGLMRRTGTNTYSTGTAVSLTTEVTGTLPEANGGTGETSFTNGQLLIGDGTGLTKATLTAANGISITNGSGSITVSTVFNPTVQTLSDGATITWNVTNGGNAVVTLSGTGRTLSITNPVAGYTYTVRIIQGSGGSKTITTWPTNTRWPSGTAPTLSTTAGQYDLVVLYYDGSQYLGTYQTNFN